MNSLEFGSSVRIVTPHDGSDCQSAQQANHQSCSPSTGVSVTILAGPGERVPSGSYSNDHDVAKGALWVDMKKAHLTRPSLKNVPPTRSMGVPDAARAALISWWSARATSSNWTARSVKPPQSSGSPSKKSPRGYVRMAHPAASMKYSTFRSSRTA